MVAAIVAVVMVSLLPVVISLCRTSSGIWRAIIVLVWLGLSLGVWRGAAAIEHQQKADEGPAARPIEHREDGYLSSRSCASCHPGQHATWENSYHPRMTDVVTPETVVGRFHGGKMNVAGETYRLERIGDEYWAEFDDPDAPAAGEKRPLRKRLVLSTGSHHMQAYWYETGKGRTLGMLPIIYLNEDQRWIPRSAAFLRPPDRPFASESGTWKMNCITCHTTGHKPGLTSPVPSSADTTRVAEFGIGCEACHGPAEEHARHYRDPRNRYARHFGAEADPLVVNPRRLAHDRASETCGQCHGVTLEHSKEAQQDWMQHGMSYRPGDDLAKAQLVVRNENRSLPELKQLLAKYPRFWTDRFWPDGMVSVSGREYNGLIESPCFQRGELSCLSCHVMHKPKDDPRPLKEWANDQLLLGMRGNQACTQCHDDLAADRDLVAHTHHPLNSEGSRCYNCHMPHTTYGLLKAIRSHEIDSPDVAVELATGRPNSCNSCHLDQSLAWTAENLNNWYGIAKPVSLNEDEKTIPHSVLRLLKGDAQQRALAAWSMGWKPAQEASGSDWMAAYLSILLADPYDAVRYTSGRSLKRLPGFKDFKYDFLAAPAQRDAAQAAAMARWSGMPRQGRQREKRLFLERPVMLRLLSERDNRPMNLNE